MRYLTLKAQDCKDLTLKVPTYLTAELSEATQGADLQKLDKANLSNANLVGTRLWGATLHNTILTGAHLLRFKWPNGS